jgi:hypothetical protein
MNNTSGKFYLGKLFDLTKSQLAETPVLYDPSDLTTHAVIVGMTGSGKTGLGIAIMEEAALAGLPAILVDPKGDITNLLLHFPALAPADFEPWIDADQARRDGKNTAQAASDTANVWKKGLADWGIAPDRIAALSRAAQFAVYTPGSTAGLPVNILASLQAPAVPWESNREILREQISATVIAILGLVGVVVADPLQSREHILLSNLIEVAWSKGQNLDLTELILQTQTPPFAKLGVFDVDTFFPPKERQTLAMRLNSVLAAPSFQAWTEGQTLDIGSLLRAADGRPRHSVFSIAHLSDEERMFFVTLLLSAVESWMRTQQGTSNLKTLLYFDELFGYLPPVANPPSKTVLLRMLKQARAFGLGLVLATQNPVDIDYKALSNAGTWCVGKLQTDQDKQRLLDGLESSGTNRKEMDTAISKLGKRIFLLHNTHAKTPQVFQTRWTMNYLAGPLTRAQIPALNKLAGATGAASISASRPAPTSTPVSAQSGSARSSAPEGIAEYFLPQNMTLETACQKAGRSASAQAKLVYRPALLAQAKARFLERKYKIDQVNSKTALVLAPDKRGVIRWQDFPAGKIDEAALPKAPIADTEFLQLEDPLNEAKTLRALEKDFSDWAFHESTLTIRVNEALGVAAGPEISADAFARLCAESAGKPKGASAALDKKLDTLREKMAKEQRELQQDQSELNQRTLEEIGTGAENVIGLLTGHSRRVSTSLTKRRLTAKAAGDVGESKQVIADLEKQIGELEKEKAATLQDVNTSSIEVTLMPAKKDVYVELFGIAWVPHYRLADGTVMPAFAM